MTFPEGFIWGTATSSYQIEGGAYEGGKGASIWDGFTHIPGRIANNDNGDIACDFYHKYREDIQLMAQLGIKNFRFSISWPRIIPNGNGKPNPEGIKFYSDVIDCLLENNITPYVTLYHWDLPLDLEMAHDGWLNPNITDWFTNYANVCFEAFGNRVKNWITFNEPWVTSILGYGQATMAPGRTSNTEPYITAHYQLIAHAKAVYSYRTNFAAVQKGRIGITCNADWREPLTQKPEDIEAAQRSLEFYLGWFADPVWLGDYPDVMKQRLGNRLPKFTDTEKALLKGSSDFFGLNHYTTMFAANADKNNLKKVSVYGNGGISEDQDVDLSVDPSWGKTEMGWAIVPWGCRKLLEWIDKRYNHPEIIITENGMAGNDVLANNEVDDKHRIHFLNGYITECNKAIQNGVNLKGYFVWSFMDNFEWALGYNKRFGITFVDYKTLKRTPKKSALWFSKVVANNGIV